MAVGPTRRAVLAASSAAVPLLLTGCRGIQALGPPPPPAPDIRLLRSVIADERLMIARYRAAIRQADAAAPAGRAAVAGLTVLLAQHEQHLTQLRAQVTEPAGYQAPPSPVVPGSGPAGLAGLLAALAASEQAASDRLASQLLAAPPSVAQLLASISASEATHVPALESLGRAR